MAQGKLLSATIRTYSNRSFNFVANGVRRKLVMELERRIDFRFGGRCSVIGTVKIAGTPDLPVQRKVRLMLRRGGNLAREMWSSPDGNYSFYSVGVGPWVLVSVDHTNEYNAVIADNILGTPM